MPFDIDKKYQETLSLLKEGKRPLIKLDTSELEQLAHHWNDLNKREADQAEYFPVLCIADHLTQSHESLITPLVYILENRQEENLLIYTLTASFKIIIEDCQKKNERIPFNFLNALKKPLAHQSWEVLEWTLRVVDQLGPQSILLKPETLARKPGLLHKLNPKIKNIFELLKMLERRWSPNE